MQLSLGAATGSRLSARHEKPSSPAKLTCVHRSAARSRVVVQANSLDSKGLFSSKSSLLGPKGPSLNGPALSPSSPQQSNLPTIDDVALESEAGVDYTKLRDLLKEGQWREAEDEQRAKLIEAAGAAAQKRGWVYFSEVSSIPAADMKTMDLLWRAASNGRFGYSVQRELWIQNRKMWPKFFKAIDWVQGENNVYRKWPTEFFYKEDAPKGHLPLTNALRGTRLFEAILEHPAVVEQLAASKGSSATPDWMK
ncbi:hypothetical protein N2152v2_005089 [Parachlorella kessleri]